MTPSREDIERARRFRADVITVPIGRTPVPPEYVFSPWHWLRRRMKERAAERRARTRGRAQLRRALMRGRREVLRHIPGSWLGAPARRIVREVYVHQFRSSYSPSPWGLIAMRFGWIIRGFRPRHVDPGEIPF